MAKVFVTSKKENDLDERPLRSTTIQPPINGVEYIEIASLTVPDLNQTIKEGWNDVVTFRSFTDGNDIESAKIPPGNYTGLELAKTLTALVDRIATEKSWTTSWFFYYDSPPTSTSYTSFNTQSETIGRFSLVITGSTSAIDGILSFNSGISAIKDRCRRFISTISGRPFDTISTSTIVTYGAGTPIDGLYEYDEDEGTSRFFPQPYDYFALTLEDLNLDYIYGRGDNTDYYPENMVTVFTLPRHINQENIYISDLNYIFGYYATMTPMKIVFDGKSAITIPLTSTSEINRVGFNIYGKKRGFDSREGWEKVEIPKDQTCCLELNIYSV